MKNSAVQVGGSISDTNRLIPDYYDKLKFPFLKMPYAFKLCEGAPGKSTAMVLEAFSKLPQYTLVVMCNWNYSEQGAWLRKMYASFTNIILLDAAYSLRETILLRANCLLYIQGENRDSSSTALLEAMYSSLPVAAFDEPANQNSTGNIAWYFETAEALQKIILQKSITDFKKLGAAMKTIAAAGNYPFARADSYSAVPVN